MSIDVSKFANAETRHPHKEILQCLVQFIEFDGEVPMHPSVRVTSSSAVVTGMTN